MSLDLLAIGPASLDVALVAALVASPDAAACGAVVTFVGTVRARSRGRRVRHLEYEAHVPLALRTLARIQAEAAAHWSSAQVACHHRIGPVAVGEASVVIAAAAPHRAEAFAACRYVIERVKQIAPIWKHEFFDDGDAWVEGTAIDPSDEVAREEAFRRACA